MYRLFTDKEEILEAHVHIEGADNKKATCRIVVENDRYDLVFKGVLENGKCSVTINKLIDILPEGTTGNMYLEVIAEGTYFKPWESEYKVVTDRKVTAEVAKQKKKPLTVSINVTTQKEKPSRATIKEFYSILKEEGINTQEGIKTFVDTLGKGDSTLDTTYTTKMLVNIMKHAK